MRPRRALATASAAQLAVQAAGLAVTLRRRLSYDFVPLGWRGSPGQTSMLTGSPFSAPVPMVVAQAAAIAVLRRRPSPLAARTLGFLGWAMIAGYLGERVVQRRLLGGEWDPVETPVAAAGLAGAAVMTVLGLGRAGCGRLGSMTTPDPQPRDIAPEQETEEQAADLEAKCEPESPEPDDVS